MLNVENRSINKRNHVENSSINKRNDVENRTLINGTMLKIEFH